MKFYHYVHICLHDVQPEAKAKGTWGKAYETIQWKWSVLLPYVSCENSVTRQVCTLKSNALTINTDAVIRMKSHILVFFTFSNKRIYMYVKKLRELPVAKLQGLSLGDHLRRSFHSLQRYRNRSHTTSVGLYWQLWVDKRITIWPTWIAVWPISYSFLDMYTDHSA
jgi:hypothetical protein